MVGFSTLTVVAFAAAGGRKSPLRGGSPLAATHHASYKPPVKDVDSSKKKHFWDKK
jgi:hypothetical protein